MEERILKRVGIIGMLLIILYNLKIGLVDGIAVTLLFIVLVIFDSILIYLLDRHKKREC